MGDRTKGSGDTTSPLHASSDGDNIKVYVRVRPLTQGTGLTTDGDRSLCLTVTPPNTIRLHSKPEPRTFTYDHVAGMDTSQEAVFSCVAKNIVESCMNGYNGTIFAYGQTGSGKTFTMLGPSDFDNLTDELRGLIPRSFEYLFFLIGREVEKSGNLKSFLCKCSFIEIYNEQIYDLLDSASASLFLRENIKKGVFVDGAVEKFVTSAAEAYQVLEMGWRNRRVASTSMNRESSRSHAVFTVTLESKEMDGQLVNIRTSQLNLVDLAGSERQKDTHVEGSRLKEASSINRSLMCLGQVIMALMDVSNGKSRHICYRDSKLTFLLKDSLGGNAKTCIIANVHPGSRCFGETWSTLQFAQRAKLIKNKAMINEDTQGNIQQLQLEVKKLKEQLAQALISSHSLGGELGPGSPRLHRGSAASPGEGVSQQEQFLQALHLWKRREEENKVLQQKLSQLEEAWAQKEKFLQSNRMILRFREDHIARLEQQLKKMNPAKLQDEQNEPLRQEIQLLREQLEHHPRMMRYAAENFGLREEVRCLRALDSVKAARQAQAQSATELEQAFQKFLESEKAAAGALPSCSTPVTMESLSAVSMERLKAQLLQKQKELSDTLQGFEEFKEVNRKRLSELEAEKRYLEKSNKHLENILEATKAHSKQEVSQLNKIHVETIKILTTPTKAYNQRSALVPLSSPEHLKGHTPPEEEEECIQNEPPPPEMTEVACEALTEELRLVQEQSSYVQNQLHEEEAKSRNLLQKISKLEEQVTMATEEASRTDKMFSSERSTWNQEQQSLQQNINNLEQQLTQEQRTTEVLRSEVHDLWVMLQASDKQLSSTKTELEVQRAEHEKENSHLSSSLISTQLQLDKVKLEFEALLEQQRLLQDAFDTLQAETKFDADQNKQHLQQSSEDRSRLEAQITEITTALQTERERASTLSSQLREDRESSSRNLVQVVEENAILRKDVQALSSVNQQQAEALQNLQQRLVSADAAVVSLEQKIQQDKSVVLDLMTQTRDLRIDLAEKKQSLDLITCDLQDVTVKYNAACLEREETRELNGQMQAELHGLREASERRVASDQIELELLQEELTYATEEVERLTKVLDEQSVLLQSTQDQLSERDSTVQNLQEQLSQQSKEREESATPRTQSHVPHTPNSFSSDVTQLLENQERELESRRSSMITMELLLTELNTERTTKSAEIQRLKAQLNEKEQLQWQINSLLEQFYSQEDRSPQDQNTKGEQLKEVMNQAVLKELQEAKREKESMMLQLTETQEALQHQHDSLSHSQICVQELTGELRNRCLELRELQVREQEQRQVLLEMEVLRKQVDHLTEENGKLVGHQNHRQKIEYLVKLKKENTRLQEENEKLRSELITFRENEKKI
ncbi:kinesin-like protein KIF15 isoform X2 [Denticeps clupeoides]|uniref:kinesin-like protein KIF15 isoform X2 n=1 Tax=Denticeps clupeoides TaxID=299321 RepID=UPI0010A464F9|nr:kinesin-like protein KIF15-A isoform X2 [Denticeps clupeoides]